MKLPVVDLSLHFYQHFAPFSPSFSFFLLFSLFFFPRVKFTLRVNLGIFAAAANEGEGAAKEGEGGKKRKMNPMKAKGDKANNPLTQAAANNNKKKK